MTCNRNQKISVIIFMLSILVAATNTTFSQFLNRDVKAIIEVKSNEGVHEITAKAENILQTKQSLSYELKVFKENSISKNKSTNAQKGRFVMDPLSVKKLAYTAINTSNKDDKVILLLLLRNVENEIIGRTRKVIVNGIVQIDKPDEIILKETKEKDGVKITGMVLERTKTKPGRDFYNFFYSRFLAYNFTDNRSVIIEEMFSRGRSTKIEIKIDNRKVYEFFVQPQIDYLKQNADAAIKQVYNFFRNKKNDYIVKY
ncbi:MAG: CsgE family curli-type amyloid fiber assembly protein [Flavobacteriaceae bacterium]